jgi:hypothetical protein
VKQAVPVVNTPKVESSTESRNSRPSDRRDYDQRHSNTFERSRSGDYRKDKKRKSVSPRRDPSPRRDSRPERHYSEPPRSNDSYRGSNRRDFRERDDRGGKSRGRGRSDKPRNRDSPPYQHQYKPSKSEKVSHCVYFPPSLVLETSALVTKLTSSSKTRFDRTRNFEREFTEAKITIQHRIGELKNTPCPSKEISSQETTMKEMFKSESHIESHHPKEHKKHHKEHHTKEETLVVMSEVLVPPNKGSHTTDTTDHKVEMSEVKHTPSKHSKHHSEESSVDPKKPRKEKEELKEESVDISPSKHKPKQIQTKLEGITPSKLKIDIPPLEPILKDEPIQEDVEVPKSEKHQHKSKHETKGLIPAYHIPKSKTSIPTLDSSDEEDEEDPLDIESDDTHGIKSPGTPQYRKPMEKVFSNEAKKDNNPVTFTSSLEYRNYFTKLLELELKEEKAAMKAKVKDLSTRHLIAQGVCLTNLVGKVKHGGRPGTGVDMFQLEFQTSSEDEKQFPVHNFTPGGAVTICDAKYTPSSKVSLYGTIIQVMETYIIVSCKTMPNNLSSSLWRLDETISTVTFDRMISALDEMLVSSLEEEDSRPNLMSDQKYLNHAIKASTMLGSVILGDFEANELERPCFALDPNWKEAFEETVCNQSVVLAIENSLKKRISLFQGPPGSGKTTTIVEYCKLYCALNPDRPILATAYANLAVDNMMERCLKRGLKCLRIGLPAKIQKNLLENTLEHVCEKDPELNKIIAEEAKLKFSHDAKSHAINRKKIETQKKKRISEIISAHQVICATTLSLADPMFAHLKFPVVVIDEATQCIEPATLIPLLHGSEQAILVGDHFQLPPTVYSEKAGKHGLAKSLFERLVDAGLAPSTLNVQYRMHPGISYWPAKNFYNGLLYDGVSESLRCWTYSFKLRNEKVPIMFYNYDMSLGVEKKVTEEKLVNHFEVDVIRELLEKLIKGHVPASDIVVLSMYAGQVELLRRKIENREVDIKTVDGFQGRERQVVILSLVRSNHNKAHGFLSDWRRMNVALTRSKRGLFIVGNRETVDSQARWKEYFDYLESFNCIVRVESVKPLTIK